MRAAAAVIVRPSLGDDVVAGTCGKRGRGRVSKSGRGSCAPARDYQVSRFRDSAAFEDYVGMLPVIRRDEEGGSPGNSND